MEFEQWQELAAAALREVRGIDPSRIQERIWRQLYIDNYAPRDAAERAVAFLHQGSSDGRTLPAAHET